MFNISDYIGQRFGILEIIGSAPMTNKGVMALTLCECGNKKVFPLTSLKIGRNLSCGCLMKKRQSVGNVIHGLSNHPLYWVWRGIKRRCYLVSSPDYGRYGGIGVLMCDEWLNNPKAFIDWALANGWERGLDIDKDIKGNGLLYSPGTCIVVTRLENQNGRKCTKRVNLDGITYTWGEIVKKFSIRYNVFANRMKMGWDIVKAIETPPRYTSRGKSPIIQ